MSRTWSRYKSETSTATRQAQDDINLCLLDGGTTAWEEAGLTLNKR